MSDNTYVLVGPIVDPLECLLLCVRLPNEFFGYSDHTSGYLHLAFLNKGADDE